MTIGNFRERIGTEGADSLFGTDLEVLYGLEGNDTLTTGTGFLPGGVATTFLVGGSGNDRYQIGTNSTAVIIDNGESVGDVLQATDIGFFNDTSYNLEIDNGRHLFFGDIESNQYVFLVDWQDPDNRLESFEFKDVTFSYQEVADNFRLFPGYIGDITEEFEEGELALIDADIAIINTRSAVLESDDILEDNLIEFYRFRNTSFSTGTYLFTGEAERNDILINPDLNQTFTLEGITEDLTLNSAFVASAIPGDELLPFYRLRSLAVPGTYLFVSTEEYNAIFAADSNQNDQWVKEGLGADGSDIPEFYLYGVGANQGIEFNRFQNTQNNTFLYAGPAETASINSDPNLANTFIDQGVAFEAFI